VGTAGIEAPTDSYSRRLDNLARVRNLLGGAPSTLWQKEKADQKTGLESLGEDA